jgi:vanillate O-demethylase ferredoxin subunit
MAFVERLQTSSYGDGVQVHVDDGPREQMLDAAAVIGPANPETHLNVCGPAGFMDHVLKTARDLGWKEPQLHREYFAAAPIDHSADGPFEIELKRSGKAIRVDADKSAAEALRFRRRHRRFVRARRLRHCVTRVLAGVPDHRDLYSRMPSTNRTTVSRHVVRVRAHPARADL